MAPLKRSEMDTVSGVLERLRREAGDFKT
jgi:hypothetical protein